MKKIKVFISSVVEGYRDLRAAADEAIVDLNREGFNFQVVRSDKLPALDLTPQKTCLEGVMASEVYLGIYGERYGWGDSPVGISPTEEEFDEAKRSGKKILIFVEKVGQRETRQTEFLKKVEDYIDGRHRKGFKTRDELKYEVARALRALMLANFEEYLPAYLQSLLGKYERITRPWEEHADSLRTSEIVQLELIDETKKEERKPLLQLYEESEEPSEKFANESLMLSDALRQNQRLLIIGDPGAGKSTCLQWITYSYAQQILNSSQADLPVPIHLELKWYKDNLLELITTCFGENNVACDEDTVKDWIKRGIFLFLLDGFDDLSTASKCLKDIKLLTAHSRENRFVITSRRLESLDNLQELQFNKVEIKPLSDSQIGLFLEKYLGKEKGARLLNEVRRHDLVNEAKNPLILWLMTLELWEDGSKQTFANKGRLFKNVIENQFLSKWDKKVVPVELGIQKYTDLKIRVLSELAFHMIDTGDSVKIEENEVKEILDVIVKEGRASYKDLRDELLRQIFAHHVLVKLGSQVSFWHKGFRDYFAALRLNEIFSRRPQDLVRFYASQRWEVPITFLVGIMDDPSSFIDRLVQPFWQYFFTSPSKFPFRLSLAAKCLGASSHINAVTEQKVIDQLVRILQMCGGFLWGFFPQLLKWDRAIRALGETRSEKALNFLAGIIQDRKRLDCLRQEAVMSMRNMPLVKTQHLLLSAALWDEDGIVRDDSKEILREGMTEETASKLVEIMVNKNEKSGIRERAIHIIVGDAARWDFRTGDSIGADLKCPNKSIDPLIQIALEEERGDLRSSAASALGYYRGQDKEERIVNLLIDALRANPDAKIRANAASALIYQFSPNATKGLIQALDDVDAEVRRRAAYSLAYARPQTVTEEDEASKRLLNLFNDEDTLVRINAICTYGIIRKKPRDEELTQLTNLLKDDNPSIRHRVAEALGRLKARNALDALKQMARDEKYVYPWAKAVWAILQIEPSFTETVKKNGWEYPYITRLYSDDGDERKMGATVLSDIGTEIALPFLKEMYEDYKNEKRRAISGELFRAIPEIEERIRAKPS